MEAIIENVGNLSIMESNIGKIEKSFNNGDEY
jgi:hypothetical protein